MADLFHPPVGVRPVTVNVVEARVEELFPDIRGFEAEFGSDEPERRVRLIERLVEEGVTPCDPEHLRHILGDAFDSRPRAVTVVDNAVNVVAFRCGTNVFPRVRDEQVDLGGTVREEFVEFVVQERAASNRDETFLAVISETGTETSAGDDDMAHRSTVPSWSTVKSTRRRSDSGFP